MNVVKWSPFRELDNLLQAFERPSAPVRRADWLPLVDIRESGDGYQIDVEIPAVAAEDLVVSVADGVLSVSGERKSHAESTEEQAEGGGRVHRAERRYGRFVRNFQLPKDADEEAINAQCKDGVLYLTIAKRQTVGRTIKIQSE